MEPVEITDETAERLLSTSRNVRWAIADAEERLAEAGRIFRESEREAKAAGRNLPADVRAGYEQARRDLKDWLRKLDDRLEGVLAREAENE